MSSMLEAEQGGLVDLGTEVAIEAGLLGTGVGGGSSFTLYTTLHSGLGPPMLPLFLGSAGGSVTLREAGGSQLVPRPPPSTTD